MPTLPLLANTHSLLSLYSTSSDFRRLKYCTSESFHRHDSRATHAPVRVMVSVGFVCYNTISADVRNVHPAGTVRHNLT